MAINNQGHLEVTIKETGYNDSQYSIVELKVSECIYLPNIFDVFQFLQQNPRWPQKFYVTL